MKTKTILAICFFVMGMILSGYSQKEKSQGYGIRAIRGEDYININGWDFYSYLSRNNWESLDEIVLMDEDSVMIYNKNASLSLTKGQSYHGTLCYESSMSKYITIQRINSELCMNNESYKDKGVSFFISIRGEGMEGNEYDYDCDDLLQIAAYSLPKKDNSELFLKDGTLCVKNNNSYKVLYWLLFELNDCFIGHDHPTSVQSGATVRYLDLPKENKIYLWSVKREEVIQQYLDLPKELVVHCFWQEQGDEESFFEYFQDPEWNPKNPIYHFTKVLFIE